MVMLVLSACSGTPAEGDDLAGGGGAEPGSADTARDSGEDSAPDSGEESGTAPFACPPTPEVPALLPGWSRAGAFPANGLSTLASSGGYPLFVGSTLSGTWFRPEARAPWILGRSRTSHTMGEVVASPAEPGVAWRSAGGIVARTTDGGESWIDLSAGSLDASSPFYGLVQAIAVATDGQRLWAVMYHGLVVRSVDRGDTWEVAGTLPVEDRDPLGLDWFRQWRLLPPDDGAPLLFSDAEYLWSSDDEGQSWTALLADPGTGYALARDPTDPRSIRSGPWSSGDGGQSWSPLGESPAFTTWRERRLDVEGAELRVSTGDASLRAALPAADIAAAVDTDLGIVVASTNHAWISEDDGTHWLPFDDGLFDEGITTIEPHPSCPGLLLAGSRCSGGLYRSTDYGQTWTPTWHHVHYVMRTTWSVHDPGTAYLVHDEQVQRSVDGGLTWTPIATGVHYHGFAEDPERADRLLLGSVGSGDAADAQGSVYLSEDGGATWSATAGIPPNTSSAHAILFAGKDVVLAGFYKAEDYSHLSGSGIGLYRSVDRGASWARVDSFAPSDVAWLSNGEGISASATWAATWDGLYRSDDEGISWSEILGGHCTSVAVHGDRVLALFADGYVQESVDGGQTWARAELQRNAADANPVGQVAIEPGGQVAWATNWALGVSWSPLP